MEGKYNLVSVLFLRPVGLLFYLISNHDPFCQQDDSPIAVYVLPFIVFYIRRPKLYQSLSLIGRYYLVELHGAG